MTWFKKHWAIISVFGFVFAILLCFIGFYNMGYEKGYEIGRGGYLKDLDAFMKYNQNILPFGCEENMQWLEFDKTIEDDY